MPHTPMKPEKAKYPKPRHDTHDIISLCKINHNFPFFLIFVTRTRARSFQF